VLTKVQPVPASSHPDQAPKHPSQESKDPAVLITALYPADHIDEATVLWRRGEFNT